MHRIAVAIALALSLGACAEFQKKLDAIGGAITLATTSSVPANMVVPAANAFDILKAGATNYGKYCIAQQMAPSICDPDIRRIVVRAVRSGSAARDQLEVSIATGQPALSSVYNVLVTAVQGLQGSPAASVKFAAGAAK